MYNSTLVHSSIGELNVTATDGHHVHVSAGSRYDGGASAPVTLRGVSYRVSAHFWKRPMGLPEWSATNPEAGKVEHAFITRAQGYEDPSFPARCDIERAMLNTVAGFMREKCGRDLLLEAECGAAETALATARESYEQAEQAVKNTLTARVEARVRLDAANHTFRCRGKASCNCLPSVKNDGHCVLCGEVSHKNGGRC
jgi:hypothetical protein